MTTTEFISGVPGSTQSPAGNRKLTNFLTNLLFALFLQGTILRNWVELSSQLSIVFYDK